MTIYRNRNSILLTKNVTHYSYLQIQRYFKREFTVTLTVTGTVCFTVTFTVTLTATAHFNKFYFKHLIEKYSTVTLVR